MYIVATPALLRNSDVLALASLCRELGASRICRFDGGKGTAYGFDMAGEADITEAEWTVIRSLISAGLSIYGANLYIEIPNSVLDNYVDVDLPGAKYTDEEGEEVRRRWENVCPVIAIGKDYSLIKIFPCQHSDVIKRGYIGLLADCKYGVYGITWDIIQQFITWAEDQGYNVLYACDVENWRSTNEITE